MDWLRGDCFRAYIVALVVWTRQVVDIIGAAVSLSLLGLHGTLTRDACHTHRRYSKRDEEEGRPLICMVAAAASSRRHRRRRRSLRSKFRSWNNGRAVNNCPFKTFTDFWLISRHLRHLDTIAVLSARHDFPSCYETRATSGVVMGGICLIILMWLWSSQVTHNNSAYKNKALHKYIICNGISVFEWNAIALRD